MKQRARKESMAEESVTVGEQSSDIGTEESTEVEESGVKTETEEEVQETETSTEEGGEKVELTEKGTKLDPNPQSAVHQQLANANARIKQMEGVLGNPAMLKRYAEQNGMTLTQAKAEIKEEKAEVTDEFTPDSFKTADDVAKGFNKFAKTIEELKVENTRLRESYKGFNSSRRLERIANNMSKDITTVQEKYPELNPNSSDYDSKLESSIGGLYKDLDFDPATNTFRGKISVLQIADKVMEAAGRARKQGSKKAQTDVKVKQAGKVTSGKSKKTGAVDSADPGTSIAQKIKKAYGG